VYFAARCRIQANTKAKIRMLLSLELGSGCGRLSKYFARIPCPGCYATTVEEDLLFGADYVMGFEDMGEKIACKQLPEELDRSFDIVWCRVPHVSSRTQSEVFMISLVRILFFYHAKNVNTLFCIESKMGWMQKSTDYLYLEAHLGLRRTKFSMCIFRGTDGEPRTPCVSSYVWSNSKKMQFYKNDCKCHCATKTTGELVVYPKEFCVITAQMLVAEAASLYKFQK
jgi:hypothetical protein